ncbi:hypothetical protein BJ508DRAFT_315077 [Ascobolus immersus RN42]|uniref:Uncharacterized protein n=1 Tax=Ascobolus immersus RN42 TaxID=1160509 RepID=A0A3N4HJ92_ASCIM|nr:hypothetical protein BJ508DRAFT_315077 [Ascobolus immersus RN42]
MSSSFSESSGLPDSQDQSISGNSMPSTDPIAMSGAHSDILPGTKIPQFGQVKRKRSRIDRSTTETTKKSRAVVDTLEPEQMVIWESDEFQKMIYYHFMFVNPFLCTTGEATEAFKLSWHDTCVRKNVQDNWQDHNCPERIRVKIGSLRGEWARRGREYVTKAGTFGPLSLDSEEAQTKLLEYDKFAVAPKIWDKSEPRASCPRSSQSSCTSALRSRIRLWVHVSGQIRKIWCKYGTLYRSSSLPPSSNTSSRNGIPKPKRWGRVLDKYEKEYRVALEEILIRRALAKERGKVDEVEELNSEADEQLHWENGEKNAQVDSKAVKAVIQVNGVRQSSMMNGINGVHETGSESAVGSPYGIEFYGEEDLPKEEELVPPFNPKLLEEVWKDYQRFDILRCSVCEVEACARCRIWKLL